MSAATAHSGTCTRELLRTIEIAFGRSASELAKMLRVSRQTIYRYRAGKEVASENKRRLQSLAEFTKGWASQIDRSFETNLKIVQPEGRTLLELLSDKELDFVTLERVILRGIETQQKDRALRHALVQELTREESLDERKDIVLERHESGKPVYVGDPANPGKIIQMFPDGRRFRGRISNRQFVPDNK